MKTVSVSNLDTFHWWLRNSEEFGLEIDWLIKRLTEKEETEEMLAGRAFHAAMECLTEQDTDRITLYADGYTFYVLPELEIELPEAREVPCEKMYGDLLVRGRVDAVTGQLVEDYKLTGQFDAEKYMESFQWRFYLDLMGADAFQYHVFLMNQKAPKEFELWQYHKLKQYRYADLHQDCMDLARQFADFAAVTLWQDTVKA
jgi:hypothetical protein